MSAAARLKLTPEEYLTLERAAMDVKSEFVDGEMYAMAGASLAHVRLNTNLTVAFGSRLKGHRCTPLSNDLRVKSGENHYCYPDVAIVCGKPELTDDQRDTLVNPSVLVEVLSPSTERWDRGGKFVLYQRIEALQEYVLVSQDAARVECYRRAGAFWQYRKLEGTDATLVLESVGLSVPLAEIYEDVELKPERPSPGDPRQSR